MSSDIYIRNTGHTIENLTGIGGKNNKYKVSDVTTLLEMDYSCFIFSYGNAVEISYDLLRLWLEPLSGLRDCVINSDRNPYFHNHTPKSIIMYNVLRNGLGKADVSVDLGTDIVKKYFETENYCVFASVIKWNNFDRKMIEFYTVDKVNNVFRDDVVLCYTDFIRIFKAFRKR